MTISVWLVTQTCSQCLPDSSGATLHGQKKGVETKISGLFYEIDVVMLVSSSQDLTVPISASA